MTTFTLRLAPLMAGVLIARLEQAVMTTNAGGTDETGRWPSLAQQYADAVGTLARTTHGDDHKGSAA